MAKNNNAFTIDIMPEEVMYTDISTSKNGYNQAGIVFKKGDKEYMRVSCEWEGDSIPAFVMDLMSFMKSNNKEKSGVWEGMEDAYTSYQEINK